MTELKPCPFCKGRFSIIRGPELFAQCEGCGVTTKGRSLEASVVLDVNQRAPASPSPSREGWLTEKDVRWWLAWFEEGRNRRNNSTENHAFERVAASVLRMALAALHTPHKGDK